MKNCIKKTILVILLVSVLLVSLTSCIDTERARGTIEAFIEAVVADDLETAATHLHPDRPTDLERFFSNIESERQVDFQSGVSIERYASVKSSYYDSKVDGSLYATVLVVKIGETKAEISVDLVENDAGYGIHNFHIYFPD